MIENNTAHNDKFHEKWHVGNNFGLRVPLDNRGTLSTLDRPFALFSNDPEWERGSVNKAVKHMATYYGKSIHPDDLADFNAGTMSIPVARKYLMREFICGNSGNSRYKVPGDMMSFRGYPTMDVAEVRLNTISINQDPAPSNEDLTATSIDFIGQVIVDKVEPLPISPGYNYVVITGNVKLALPMPFDEVWIAIRQEIKIQDFYGQTLNMFGGDLLSSVGADTRCTNVGDNLNFTFRLYAELSTGNFNDGNWNPRTINVILDKYIISPVTDDFFFGNRNMRNSKNNAVPVTYDGQNWIGQVNIDYADVTKPQAPYNLTVISDINNLVTVGWQSDDVDNDIVLYQLFWKGQEDDLYIVIPTTQKQASIQLTANRTWNFRALAIDNNGNVSDNSVVLTYSTQPGTMQDIFVSTAHFSAGEYACPALADSIACKVANVTNYLNGVGGTMYEEGIPFNGDQWWYKVSRYRSMSPFSILRIDTQGVVSGMYQCGGSGA